MDLSSSLARLEAEGQARWEDEIKTNKDSSSTAPGDISHYSTGLRLRLCFSLEASQAAYPDVGTSRRIC